MNLIVRASDAPAPADRPVEVVERKGIGHPDSMCDGLAEHLSVRLCRYYVERFGRILHHNVDKVLLVGGAARPALGGGEITSPMEIYLAGRATNHYRDEAIPVDAIAVDAACEWLRGHVPLLDLAHDVRIVPRLHGGSDDLVRIFGASEEDPRSNDTSCGVGFAPFTPLERLVLGVERRLNDPVVQERHPAIGCDIKVMGVRAHDHVELTIACAFVGRFLKDLDAYRWHKDTVRDIALRIAAQCGIRSVTVAVNAADDMDAGDIFLTVTGTSAECGDDGEVGRGNRTSGLITPFRPMTLEAAAGKNPVNHVGKLYNLAAGRIATAVTVELGLRGATVVLVGQIGAPLSTPQLVDVQLDVSGLVAGFQDPVAALVRRELTHLDRVRSALLDERALVS